MAWLDEYKKEQLKDPVFKNEYQNLDFEFQLRRILVEAREQAGKTQTDVSKQMNTFQSAISRWENHPEQMTIKNLKEYADSIGAKVSITLEKN